MIYQRDADLFFPDGEEHMTGRSKKTGRPVCVGYQLDRLERAARFVTNWDLAVDVGAHVGIFTRYLAARFKSVVAVEPDPANFECLEKNTATLANVTRVQCALGDENREAGIAPGDRRNTGNRQLDLGGSGVPVRRLDDVSPPGPGLVKIDVQGYELFVLRGGAAVIATARPVVIMECEPAGKLGRQFSPPEAAANFLAGLGAVEVDRVGHDRIFSFGEQG